MLFALLSHFAAKDRSKKMTSGIIRLYETLKQIKNRDENTQTTLTFKQQSHEINNLHLRFNDVMRTTLLSEKAMTCDKKIALLNYSEAYSIFEEFEDDQ